MMGAPHTSRSFSRLIIACCIIILLCFYGTPYQLLHSASSPSAAAISLPAAASNLPAAASNPPAAASNPPAAASDPPAAAAAVEADNSFNITDALVRAVDVKTEMVGDKTLYQVLKELSAQNGDTGPILVQVNSGFIDMALNLYCSLRQAGLTGVLFWSADSRAHQNITAMGMASYFNPELFTAVEDRQFYREGHYVKMMRERTLFLRMIVSAGLGLWWIDADTVVLKDFRPLLNQIADVNVQMDADQYIDWSDPKSEHIWRQPCGGFFHLKSTPAGRMFIDNINSALARNPGFSNQDAISDVVWNGNQSLIFNAHPTDKNCRKMCTEQPLMCHQLTKVSFFRQQDIISGHVYFGEWDRKATFPAWHDDFTLVHANGVRHKLPGLKHFNLWTYPRPTSVGLVCTNLTGHDDPWLQK